MLAVGVDACFVDGIDAFAVRVDEVDIGTVAENSMSVFFASLGMIWE